MTTPRLGAPELTSGQATPETTVNEQIRTIEIAAGHFIFKDRDLAAPPGSPADGDCYLVAASPTGAWAGQAGKIAYRLNTAWKFITAIEGFTAWVNDENVFIGYDGAAWSVMASPSGVYIPLSYLDTDGTLTANSDAKVASQKATKTYVDGKVAGLSWKQAVRAATTANGTLASAYENGDTIDGVTLATGDRILIKNQTAASENGIYTINASGAPTRATDADSGAELVNASVYVSEGTTLADTQWVCTTNATITVGSTSLSFAQLTSGGGALQASNNLSDLANAGTARTNLGLGSIATEAEAIAAQIQAGTASKAVAADKLAAASAPQALTDGATITWDLSAGFNATVTIAGNRTLAVTNPVAGWTYSLGLKQDGTGSRTMTWPSSFDWGTTGAPTLTATANKVDRITFFCTDAATPKFQAYLSGKGFAS